MIRQFFTIEDFNKTPDKIVGHIAIKIYQPDMTRLTEREVFRAFPEALRTIILIINFDTEVSMNSILGFLENSTGEYLPETAEAFRRIGAEQTSTSLHNVQKILERHQASTQQLRDDVSNLPLYSISSFADTHSQSEVMAEEIDQAVSNLYIYQSSEDREPIWEMLYAYVGETRNSIVEELKD